MNLLLLLLVPACFALNPVIGRAMSEAFGPASLSVTRWALSGLIIAVVAVGRGGAGRWQGPAGLYERLVALGALGMGFCAYAAFAAARTTEATNVGLIYACTTPLVASYEIAAGRQRANWGLLAGIGACLAGVGIILTRGHPETLFNLTFSSGDLWAAAGMVVFAGYTVALRRTPTALTPLAQFVIMSIGATLALLPFCVDEVLARGGLPPITLATLPWLAILVLVAGIGAFLGYTLSLMRNGPVLTAASISLTPIYAAALAITLIGERLAWYHGVALALVVGGLLLINRGQGK
jgi:drug/metabolite transporter (DMT)-like permease